MEQQKVKVCIELRYDTAILLEHIIETVKKLDPNININDFLNYQLGQAIFEEVQGGKQLFEVNSAIKRISNYSKNQNEYSNINIIREEELLLIAQDLLQEYKRT